MPLSAGARVGPYEILALVGTGGMGEVYRARDSRLDRDVALKILREPFAADRDRTVRFEREAKTLAALNHPNIAHIYGFERSGDISALAMELVDGPTLADLIARGPLPLDEALPIARQIAEALEAAHEQGIIHRDLKPANIKVRADGRVKVLDFGLAKALDPAPAVTTDVTSSPTLSVHATMAGMILGTAAYMAPEQARGKAVDRRADIWAFGAVLYEMLTGRRAFDGDDVSITLAAVIMKDPDWTAMPPRIPPSIRQLLRRCLDRDVTTRLRDIGEARIAVQHYLKSPEEQVAHESPLSASRAASVVPWVAAILSTSALVILAVVHWREKPIERPSVHVSIPSEAASLAISPDGRWLVTATSTLSLRSLRTGEVRELPGTAGARAPFWSPDSRSIGFFSFLDRTVRAVPVSGGTPQVLCEGIESGAGGTWNRSGVILLSTGTGSFVRTSADRGQCTEIPKSQLARGRAPVFLPDGEHFLYGGGGPGIFVASLSDPTGKRLLMDTSSALFVPNSTGTDQGRLLFLRDQSLMAQAFDARSFEVSGEPVRVADRVGVTNTGAIGASIAGDGTLVYRTNNAAARQLGWYDRSGRLIDSVPVKNVRDVTLSPDGKRIVYSRSEANKGSLWVWDFETQLESRLTDESLDARIAVWTGDRRRVAFSAPPPQAAIYVKDPNRAGSGEIITRGAYIISDWARDDRWLAFSVLDEKTGPDIWLLADPLLSQVGKPFKVVGTAAVESQGQISPDGKWLAYYSSESAPGQVYLTPLTAARPAGEMRWQASTVRGVEPRWRGDGKELFYLEPTGLNRVKMMSVAIGALPSPTGKPVQLFEFDTQRMIPVTNVFSYAVSPDGQRFLLNAMERDLEPSIEIVLNWATAQP